MCNNQTFSVTKKIYTSHVDYNVSVVTGWYLAVEPIYATLMLCSFTCVVLSFFKLIVGIIIIAF